MMAISTRGCANSTLVAPRTAGKSPKPRTTNSSNCQRFFVVGLLATFILYLRMLASLTKDAVAALRQALCPLAKRENYFAEFEQRRLRSEEDPSVYKWELENILSKADPSLPPDAKTALLSRQFMKGLPDAIKFKLLEHNPTPTLDEMMKFTQRFRAVGNHVANSQPIQVNATTNQPPQPDPQLTQLLSMVAGNCGKAKIPGGSSHQDRKLYA